MYSESDTIRTQEQEILSPVLNNVLLGHHNFHKRRSLYSVEHSEASNAKKGRR
jgi:hypothetical protein